MLIRKGNFPKFKLWMAWLAMLLACAMAVRAQAEARPAARAPDAVATEFYGWYLETLSADQDPLSDRYAIFTHYVAKDLADKLVERLRSKRTLDADYFIQSQDYRQDWMQRVHASVVRQNGASAEVVVTLGKEGSAMRVLGLAMVLENGAWKIRHVARVDGDLFKSSSEQSVI